MGKSENKEPTIRPANYNLWVGVFCVLIFVAAGAFYYASQKIEYVWRWNRVPIYFAYKDDIQITSAIDGDVESVTTGEKESIITGRDRFDISIYRRIGHDRRERIHYHHKRP